MVVKIAVRRERFDRQKVLTGVLKACEKRPVSIIQLETIADKAEVMVQDSSEREVSTTALGEMIMNELKNLDKVAYVRFASVYLDFKDVQEFMSELKELLKSREKLCTSNSSLRRARLPRGFRQRMFASARAKSSPSLNSRVWTARTCSFRGMPARSSSLA